MRASTATPQLRLPHWAWQVAGAYIEVTRTSQTEWMVSVGEGGCRDVWDIVWEGEGTGFRSIGSPNGDLTEKGFWNLCPWICSEYEPCHAAGRLP